MGTDGALLPRLVGLRQRDGPRHDAEVLLGVGDVAADARGEVGAQAMVLRPVLELGADIDARHAGREAHQHSHGAAHGASAALPAGGEAGGQPIGHAHLQGAARRPAL